LGFKRQYVSEKTASKIVNLRSSLLEKVTSDCYHQVLKRDCEKHTARSPLDLRRVIPWGLLISLKLGGHFKLVDLSFEVHSWKIKIVLVKKKIGKICTAL